MREILFRGKRIDSGKWVEGEMLHDMQDRPHLYWKTPKELPIVFSNHAIVDPATLGQFTGLTDKNGKKIFEGDILVIRNCREHPVLVKFIEFSWQCVIPNVNAYIHYRHRLENNYTKYEVIGNIHDNPELLEDPNV